MSCAFVTSSFILLEQKHWCFWKRQISRLLDCLKIFILCTHYHLRWMIWLYVKFFTGNNLPSEFWRLCTTVFWLPVLQRRNLMNSWFSVLCILFCFFFGRIWGFLSHRFLQLCDSRSWCGISHLLVSIHGGPLHLKMNVLQFWKKNFFSFLSLIFSSLLFLSGTPIFPIKASYLFLVLWTPFHNNIFKCIK